MAKVFTAQDDDGNSSEQRTGVFGKALVMAEGGFDSGTIAVQVENPDGGFATITQGGTALTYTGPFCAAVDIGGEVNLRLALTGVAAAGATIDAWILPIS